MAFPFEIFAGLNVETYQTIYINLACIHNIYKGESHKYKDVSISHIVDFVYVSGFHAL